MCDMNAIEQHVNEVVLSGSPGLKGVLLAAAPSGTGLLDGMFQLLADPAIRGNYLIFCFALMVLPMIGLALWYHSNINKTEGGRQLMRRQNASRVQTKGSINTAYRNVNEASSLARDIESGAYGEDAKAMQHKVYWVVGLWVVAITVAFGILIWADEVNRAVAAT